MKIITKVQLERLIMIFTLTFVYMYQAGAAGYTKFAQVQIPLGIAIDQGGNIVVSADHTFDHGVEIYSPYKQFIGYIQQGGFIDTSGRSYLARLPGTRFILALRQDGLIQKIDTTTGLVTSWQDLRLMNVDTRSIYDLAQKRFWNFGGLIIPRSSTYGDISILRRSNSVDLFLTGLSQAQTFPFVLRIRVTANSVRAKVIAASSASTAGQSNVARGIAVNASGTVATTLPYQYKNGVFYGIYDRLVSFSADFPETQKGIPAIKLSGRDMASRGIAADTTGKFYVATGSVGTSLAGSNGSGSLIVLDPNLTKVLKIKKLDVTVGDSRDVVVNSNHTGAYMTVLNYDAVVYFSLP